MFQFTKWSIIDCLFSLKDKISILFFTKKQKMDNLSVAFPRRKSADLRVRCSSPQLFVAAHVPLLFCQGIHPTTYTFKLEFPLKKKKGTPLFFSFFFCKKGEKREEKTPKQKNRKWGQNVVCWSSLFDRV